MDVILDNRPTKPWRKLDHAADMPHQVREPAQA
jgi:hypothetical protein